MASSRLLFTCTTVLLFLPLLFLSPSNAFSSYPNDDGRLKVSAVGSQKVNLSLYYDALCPSCATFIVKNLAGVFDKDLITIINLRLVPWGNSFVNKSNNAIVCQHGSEECVLNTLEACAIDVLHDVDKHYALIYCFEFLVIEGRHKDWQTCFDSLGLPKKPVLDCYISGNGTKLIQKYADETAHLNPPHTFAPWVVVNNQPLQEDTRSECPDPNGPDQRLIGTWLSYAGLPKFCNPCLQGIQRQWCTRGLQISWSKDQLD